MPGRNPQHSPGNRRRSGSLNTPLSGPRNDIAELGIGWQRLFPGLVFCLKADNAPAEAGAYVLVVEIDASVAIRIAGKPAGTLPAGRYLYCGSANGPGGLRARLSRHMRRRKAVRWHIDQITGRGRVLGAWVAPGGDECAFVDRLAFLPVPIAGFGSSDCERCRSHLLACPNDGRQPAARQTAEG